MWAAHNLPSAPGRERTLHHVKLAAGIVPGAQARARAISATRPSPASHTPLSVHLSRATLAIFAAISRDLNLQAPSDAPPQPPLCAWLLAGSHNLSGAAWGKVEEVDGETELVVMSYELSVLLVPQKPVRG